MDVGTPAVDLENLRGDAVEDVAVVRDEKQAPRERRESVFEVGDGVEVEMVGRLVEDECIPLAAQK